MEKPGAISREEFEKLVKCADDTQTKVYIAYNRRFYASVLMLEKIIEQDGGCSLYFEFTEWPHTVVEAGLPEETLKNWLILLIL